MVNICMRLAVTDCGTHLVIVGLVEIGLVILIVFLSPFCGSRVPLVPETGKCVKIHTETVKLL